MLLEGKTISVLTTQFFFLLLLYRASSSYIIYSSVCRQQIMAEYPTMSITDASKIIGQRWKDVTADEKIKYEALAAADKARYQLEMEAYRNGTYVHVPKAKPVKKTAVLVEAAAASVDDHDDEDVSEDEEDEDN